MQLPGRLGKWFTFEPIELQTSNKRVLNSNGRQLQILF